MADDIRVEIRGLKEVQKKMEQIVKDMHGGPFIQVMKKATLLVARAAKQNAPVDTGRLRASITPEIRRTTREVQGVVGSNVKYAPFVELGTRPHWPPVSALEVWAARHGTSAYLVARAISKRGTRARRYLQRAVEENADKIKDLLTRFVAEIIGK